jgi:predicted nucleotidyltransferase
MDQRQLPEDFKDFIRFLNKNDVCYLLVGGWATGLYGHPRATKDIDILVALDDENMRKLKGALSDFGAQSLDLTPFMEEGSVYRMGRSPIQIDIINHADGIDVRDCFSRRKVIRVDDVEIMVISREDLIINKKASGRLQDLADVESLSGKYQADDY